MKGFQSRQHERELRARRENQRLSRLSVLKAVTLKPMTDPEWSRFCEMTPEARSSTWLMDLWQRPSAAEVPAVVAASLHYSATHRLCSVEGLPGPELEQKMVDRLVHHNLTPDIAYHVSKGMDLLPYQKWELSGNFPLVCSDKLKDEISRGAIFDVKEGTFKQAPDQHVVKLAQERLQAKVDSAVLEPLPGGMDPKVQFSAREAHSLKMVADSAVRVMERMVSGAYDFGLEKSEDMAREVIRNKSLG